MKFRTRLQITFISIIVLPLLLTALAFFAIGLFLMGSGKGFPVGRLDYASMTENMRQVSAATDNVFFELKRQIETDPARLADTAYLEHVNAGIPHKTTYILVRKDDALYYAGNEAAAEAIFSSLPASGRGTARRIPRYTLMNWTNW